MRTPLNLMLWAALLAAPATAFAQSAAEHEQAVAALVAELRTLEGDPSLADRAGLERLKARQAVAAAQEAKRRDREHSVRIAGLRIAAARAAAEADLLVAQSAQLDSERDQIMLEASRREAERVRRENERLRLQGLAREEALQRELEETAAAQTIALEAAEAEAAQARKLAQARAREAELARKEAELAAAVAGGDITDAPAPPSRREGGRTVYTLAGNAFGSGSASLTAQAQASLRTLAASLSGGGAIRIEGHTDSQGAEAANQALSKRRADAVRRALEDAGVAAGRLSATGKGEGSPVADNGSADGRARNRRVEIIVE
jgi:outer membrane protein OmpA-like peptidoglycan-associated protein